MASVMMISTYLHLWFPMKDVNLKPLQIGHRSPQQRGEDNQNQREVALTVSNVTNVEACSQAHQITPTVMYLMNQTHFSRITASQERPVCGTPGKSQEAPHPL